MASHFEVFPLLDATACEYNEKTQVCQYHTKIVTSGSGDGGLPYKCYLLSKYKISVFGIYECNKGS